MKRMVRFTAFLAGLLVSQLCLAQAPAGAPAGATGLCKDGTYTTAQSKQGACRGHQGVKTWFAAAAPAPAKTPAAKKPAPAATRAATPARSAGQAPVAPVPAGATGLCKDGTYTTAQSKQGACRGHQGVETWFAAAAPAPAAKPAPAPARTQAPAPARSAGQAPVASAPAGATGLCKDGTYTKAQSKQGACRGHQGVETWFAAAAAVPAAKSASPPAPAQTQTPTPARPAAQPPAAPPPAPRTAADTSAQAPGGGPDQVWLNTATNVYHCFGSQWYGKTKSGAYMTEAEAQAKGARANRGKPCK